MGTAISGLVAATELNEADIFEIEQAGVSKKLTKQQLRALMYSDPLFASPALLPKTGDVLQYNGTDFAPGAVPQWRVIDQVAYTEASVATSSTITFAGGGPTNGVNLKGGDYFAVGDPVRVVISAVSYYGICSAVSDTLLTITGAPLPLSTAITSLSVGRPDMVKRIPIFVGKSDYAASVANINAGVLRWRGRTGYLVTFSATHDTTGQPKINIKCNGNLVSTNDSNNGIQLSATPGTFVDNSAVAISTANYAIADSQDVVISVTAAVSSQNFLSVMLVFVVP